MSRLDIKIKAGTRIIVDYGDGLTITHETVTDTDIDHLYDTLSRVEQFACEKPEDGRDDS
ncbi:MULTISPECIES: hypothetical protein [unclassified Microbacterium]|uniref:hypothetical protein n=1 Tax=unclassified Microbacterium TaxID=2609290 RepID=UPI00246894DA|nr:MULTISPECIES: hypothetical protein [unclassified Microbacterium]MDH5134981.1 hypothetical protein [Microbacterium sp. RD10]MDH5138552.1 hypothetical protein [Microbacterium sp. RD11]MDH5146928.1 hypothetical protein [Microbacterium sp. RD12]MDH5156630.1 hypothetical protein [Microbacterium sp. RD06]MDH5168094.1 hypothetical protein [Microbacterium sp. RD02]